MYNLSNPGSNTVMHVNNKINIFAIFCQTMGYLHDDVIQLLLVESFRVLLSFFNCTGDNSKFNNERKNEIDSGSRHQ